MDITALLDAIATQHWALTAGLVIVLLVYVANRFGLKDKIGAKYVPWVAAALGVASAIATNLVAGQSWPMAVEQGFMAGASATGLWEMVFQHVLPSSTAAAPKA